MRTTLGLLLAFGALAASSAAQGPLEDCPPPEVLTCPGDYVITQGDVDRYERGTLCLSGFDVDTYRLTLMAPSPGDAVALTVAEDMPPSPFVPGTALATYEQPSVEASTLALWGCDADAMVYGLQVAKPLSYALEKVG